MAAPSQLAADQGRCRDGIPVKTSQISTGGREEKRPRKREDRARERKRKIYRKERERERGGLLLHRKKSMTKNY